MSSYPPTLNHTGGTVEIFTSLFARLKFLERVQDAGLAVRPIPPLGSVGLAAVHLALTDSSLPIFCSGLILPISRGKLTPGELRSTGGSCPGTAAPIRFQDGKPP